MNKFKVGDIVRFRNVRLLTTTDIMKVIGSEETAYVIERFATSSLLRYSGTELGDTMGRQVDVSPREYFDGIAETANKELADAFEARALEYKLCEIIEK